MQPSDLQKVCQWAKSNHSPSDVYNAACRLLDQVGEFERLRRLEMFGDEKHTARLAEIDRLQDLLHERSAEVERLRAELAEAIVQADAQFQARLEEVAERDALKAAIEKVRYLLERWQQGRGTETFPAIALRSITAALDSPKTPEKGAESHGDARTPQTQGASEADGENEAQEGSDG